MRDRVRLMSGDTEKHEGGFHKIFLPQDGSCECLPLLMDLALLVLLERFLVGVVFTITIDAKEVDNPNVGRVSRV